MIGRRGRHSKSVMFALISLFLFIAYIAYVKRNNYGEATPQQNQEGSNKFDAAPMNIRQRGEAMQKCLMEAKPRFAHLDPYHRVERTVQTCKNQHFPVTHFYNNRDEMKAILPLRHRDLPCTFFTAGIGYDIAAEKLFKDDYPNCRFYGTDPTLHNKRIYEKIGQYYSSAIAAEDNTTDLLTIHQNGNYGETHMPTVDFLRFLKENLPSLIDYAWIDIEGSELKIFQKYFVNDALEQENQYICQIDVEFHNFYKKDVHAHLNELGDIFDAVVASSSFVPVFANMIQYMRTIKLSFVNYRSEKCLKRYTKPYPCASG